MKVLVCGGRNYDDGFTLGAYLGGLEGITEIIHGGARGADDLAGKYAEFKGIKETVFNADWSQYGRAAGPIRNALMIEDGKPDMVVAFAGGRGTANMVKVAKAAGVKVVEITEPIR